MGVQASALAVVIAAGLTTGAAAPAAAQSQGPLVLMPANDRTVIAPEVRITEVNGTTGTLIGLSAGRELDGRLFLGGAGYWLADPRDTTRLFYLGLVAGWQLVESDRLHVGVRGLLGGGEATVWVDDAVPWFEPDWRRGGRFVQGPMRVGWRDSVLVAEPEIRAEFDLTGRVRLALGGSYRVTNASGWMGDRLEGASGGVSLQFRLGR
jgi:hypothetical protein